MASPRWRVGRSLGRTLYVGDNVVGMVDNKELAAVIVHAVNGWLEKRDHDHLWGHFSSLGDGYWQCLGCRVLSDVDPT